MTLARELLPERQCHKCSESQKERWGCTKDTTGVPYILDDEKLTRCPIRPLLDFPVFFREVYDMYRWFGKNFLPEPGTWMDQSLVFVSCVEIIEKALSDASDIKRDKMDRLKEASK